MLIGEYQHNIDKKGRVFIPAKLREDLGEVFFVTKGLDNTCLFIYPQAEWDKLGAGIRTLPMKDSMRLQRFLFGDAAEMECDAQGRVCIPQKLRGYAELEGATTIIGAYNRVEIWNAEKWEKAYEGYSPDSVMDLMEDLKF